MLIMQWRQRFTIQPNIYRALMGQRIINDLTALLGISRGVDFDITEAT